MKNPITKIFDEISDDELTLAISEIKESEKTGFVGDIVREYARKIQTVTSDLTLDLMNAQIHLLRQAAYRWVEKTNP